METTYRRVSDNIKNIKSDFNDGVITYEAAREELAGYSSFYKTEVDDAISELDRLKESKAAFQQAEEKYQKEEYEQAYMYYKEVDKYTRVTFFGLFGQKIPFILDNTLSKDVEFQVMFRKDYERIEKEKLIEKFYKIFD